MWKFATGDGFTITACVGSEASESLLVASLFSVVRLLVTQLQNIDSIEDSLVLFLPFTLLPCPILCGVETLVVMT